MNERQFKDKNGRLDELKQLKNRRDIISIQLRAQLPMLKKIKLETYEELMEICKKIHFLETKKSA